MAKKSASGISRELAYSDGKSNKFWTIRLKGSTYTVTFGRVGTAGQAQVKAFDSPLEAKAAFEKMVAEKLAKGYEELHGKSAQQDMSKTERGIKTKAKTIENVSDPNRSASTKSVSKRSSREASQLAHCNPSLKAYPQLTKARESGATLLRAVFNGHGDDGFFEYYLFRDSKELSCNRGIDEDVLEIIKKNEFNCNGINGGTIGILEIDLTAGKAIFWDGQQGSESERFAEFLMRCKWEQATSISADVKLEFVADDGFAEDDDDTYCGFFKVKKILNVKTTPSQARRKLQSELRILLDRIGRLEDGEEVIEKIGRECGLSASLVIDVDASTFAFVGNGKKVSFRVPEKALTVRRVRIG